MTRIKELNPHMDKKLVSIRGAVTADNTVNDITGAVRLLVRTLYFKNALRNDDVVNITVSATDDITAFHPARVIRECGFAVPLFSCVEPNIDGGLKGCIRIMITAYSDNPVRNIYLRGARALRPDISGTYAIALDGPSGAGKSTVAKIVAKKLGITYLDTGALYRALGLKTLSCGVSIKDAAKVEECLSSAEVIIEYRDGAQHVILDGEDVSGRIRTPEVSMAASAVSAIPYVRQKLLSLQREISKTSNVILDGRDIGTVVLPDAEFKYFLTASPEVRAKRRYDELAAKGESVTFDSVLADVNERDKNDSTRAVAPLKQAVDAVSIVSDDISAEAVADRIVRDVTECL